MPVPVRRRTRARELALQFLYTIEMRGSSALEDLEEFVDHHVRRSPDTRGRAEVRAYALSLVRGVQERRDELNLWIDRIAANWRLERMAHVDRNVLRIAVWELLYAPDVPFKVVINEAIDLAKRFSTAQSGAFVNGILDRARVLIQEQREAGIDPPVPPDPETAPAGREARDSSLRPPPAPTPRPRRRTLEAPPAAAGPDLDAPSPGEDFPLPESQD